MRLNAIHMIELLSQMLGCTLVEITTLALAYYLCEDETSRGPKVLSRGWFSITIPH